ncbi:RdgB/HAM1 family non-canonical purine NTP pyrophosphatase [Parvularcula sp. LCG005]|uniref:RdgB/HAM1 family non-canonical purine NTP pyrophosphatase n=1 Tax=Parvularcula sp. LCG005 TaxID=3078805 RepID=UPI002942F4BF|nr:RdgB/HAM1 family non-canonical purine NTP pyrophosphatase [Parvularcula sp. LCG005]WOI53517.1 RdgB/HAM1 family non-canonical purine NTP pyrophosphatase [Parvularcula sp. LCG005]
MPVENVVRLQSGQKLVLATHNAGKVREFQRMMGEEVHIVSAEELGLAEPEETGTTFVDNALLKAKAAATASGLVSMADDSGLAVAGLGGEPGIYSARWAGPGKDYAQAFARIADELAGRHVKAPFNAAFVCVLAVVTPDGDQLVAEGRVDGTLVFPPRGEAGFGYDSIFVPEGAEKTFAEMAPDDKAAYSHRARAWRIMAPQLMPEVGQ